MEYDEYSEAAGAMGRDYRCGDAGTGFRRYYPPGILIGPIWTDLDEGLFGRRYMQEGHGVL
ncbi:hypothetical protein D3C76_1591260 [compost metagenome]